MSFESPPWPPPWPEIEASIKDLLQSGDWGRYKSPHQQDLRNLLGQLCNVEHVRLCGSGSAAIEIALRVTLGASADVPTGVHEVILAAFDYPGNFRAIESVGARPVLVDVESDGLGVDPEQVIAAASPNVCAVIASHLYGRGAQIAKLRQICDDQGWLLIEDACQVPGMTIGSQPVGSFGHIAALSFGGSKPLTAGNGGAVLTNDDLIAARLGAMLDRPSDSQPLSTLQCSVLLPQLNRLDECNDRRRATIAYLETSVNPALPNLCWLSTSGGGVSATHYKVGWTCESLERRSKIIARAAEVGLPIGEGFRSMSRSSERRCRKPVALDRSIKLGECVIVLDHSALLIESERYEELGQCLIEVMK